MQFLKRMIAPDLPEDIGNVHLEWTFREYPDTESRTRLWYTVMGLIFALCMFYAIFTSNWIFALILILSGFIMIAQHFRDARQIPVKIGEDGIIVDRKFYPYKEMDSFGIIYDPPVYKFLYLDMRNGIRSSLPVPMESVNPLQLREVLLNYLSENLQRQEEDFDEIMAKLLKIG
jgi:hypothetical protein